MQTELYPQVCEKFEHSLRVPHSSWRAELTGVALWIFALCVGCDLDDDRTLHPVPDGAAGAAGALNDGSLSAGGSSTTGVVSTTAAGGASSVATTTTATTGGAEPRCPDLDANEVLDCEETLVENATFDSDAQGWQADERIAIQWNEEVSGGGGTGSLEVTHEGSDSGDGSMKMAGSYQCIAASALRYVFAAETFLQDGQGDALVGLSGVFYESEDCSGTPLTTKNSSMQKSTDGWRILHDAAVAPARTLSLKLRLVVIKSDTEDSVDARFDNVLVRLGK